MRRSLVKKIGIYGILIISLGILSACWQAKDILEKNTIIFSDYTIEIDQNLYESKWNEDIDPRLSSKILALYVWLDQNWYQDNMVISQDKISPNASLQDYVKSSLGGIAHTWSKYTTIGQTTRSLSCSALTIPVITTVFSIYRIAPDNTTQTIYFVQTHLQKLSEITTISASTSIKENVTKLQQRMESISCNFS